MHSGTGRSLETFVNNKGPVTPVIPFFGVAFSRGSSSRTSAHGTVPRERVERPRMGWNLFADNGDENIKTVCRFSNTMNTVPLSRNCVLGIFWSLPIRNMLI